MRMPGLVKTPGGMIAIIVVSAAYFLITQNLFESSVQVIPAGYTGSTGATGSTGEAGSTNEVRSIRSGSLTFEITTVEQQVDGVMVMAKITNSGKRRISSANGTCTAKDASKKRLMSDDRQIISPDNGLAPREFEQRDFFLWGLYKEDIAYFTFFSSSVVFL